MIVPRTFWEYLFCVFFVGGGGLAVIVLLMRAFGDFLEGE